MVKVEDFKLDMELDTVTAYDSKKKESIVYYNVPCSFDIETTSTVVHSVNKFAFMYEWTFGIKSPEHICYGRTWEEFLNLCKELIEKLDLHLNKRLVIYVHNLSYEFQFMRKFFQWDTVFAVDERKPIKAVTINGIEFRDSYILSGYSLAKLAENLVSHKIEKLVGDLDYSLCRNSKTELSTQELAYCNNDVEIVIDYIEEQIQQYGNITRIPLTNTGRVRQYVKNNCLHSSSTHRKDSVGKQKRYRDLMQECSITPDEYTMLKRCFMGGFTHASMKWSGETLENVASIDFTSSYPAVMLSEKYPMSKPIPVDLEKENFKELFESSDFGLMFDCKLVGVHANNTFESYLSESKCFDTKGVIANNGRIFEAEEVTTTITDIDLRVIKKCYKIDKIAISNCYKFYMQYLPKPILMSVLELYQKKTTLKGVEGSEVEYLLSKGMLNSVYGMCVTDIVRCENVYDGEWSKTPMDEATMQEQIDKYNKSKTRFLYYAWGVWVTAYARLNLWTGILNIADDYIYSDTDSIKFLNYENHTDFIEWYNKRIEQKLRTMCEFRKIDFAMCKPKTIKGVEKLIGVWDFEGVYTKFKTLGAKRYIYEQDGKLHITIAGLSKSNGVAYMLKACNGDVDRVFKMFNNDLYIPPEYTGKNTHTYIDTAMTETVTDYQGNTEEIYAPSSVHLSECDFTLSISKQYNKFLCMLRDGYLFIGRDKV